MSATQTLCLDRAAFFKTLGYQPHTGQEAVHASRAHRRVLACGVRWGKSTCAAVEGMAAAMEPRFDVHGKPRRSVGWVVAPTYDLADKVYRELVYYAHERIPEFVYAQRTSDRSLHLVNLGGEVSEIRAKSGDNPTSLLGEGLDWLIVDEAARLKPLVWESHLSQRLIDRKGWALLISTPRGKGWFYNLWRRGQRGIDPEYESWNRPSWTNPHLDADLIEAERAKLPERVFRQEYGAEFIEGAGAVFRNVQEMATGSFKPPVDGVRFFAGLDLARVEDYTVLTILDESGRVWFIDRFTRLDWSIQLGRIKAALDRYKCPVVVDSTGAGEPIYEAMLGAGCNVEPYQFTHASKAALIDNLALMCEREALVLPSREEREPAPTLLEELEAFEYSITDSGNVKTGAPSGIHDDAVISLALAAWQIRPDKEKPYRTLHLI